MIKEIFQFVDFAENGMEDLKVGVPEFLLQMSRLESEINHKIITQKSGKLALSEVGKVFLPYAKKFLSIFEELTEFCNEINVYDQENQIVLGISRDTAASWGLRCIKNFNKMHPGLRMSVIAHDSLSNVMVDQATIVFWCFDFDIPNFDKLWYIEYKYALFASSTYLQNHSMPTLETINNHKIIAYSGSDNNLSFTNWHLTGKYGLPILKPTIFSQSRDIIAKMVADGIGIGAVCDRQDIYYGYKNVERVLKTVDGPVLRSYFAVRSGLSEQMQCNANLLNQLFRTYFEENFVEVYDA